MDLIAFRMLNLKRLKWPLTAAVFMLAGLSVGYLAHDPDYIRLLAAAAIILPIAALGRKSPQAALIMLLVYLPFMSFLRRLLIPIAGWSSLDPLLLVAPVTVLLFFSGWLYRTYLLREPIRDESFLFKCVRWMLLVDVLQIFNPLQGSILTGIAGVIFWVVPVVFMILSREYVDEKLLKRIFAVALVIGILSAAYGYKQFLLGYSFFEKLWVEQSGYTALMVYGTIRPVSFFASGAEYGYYLAIALVISWVCVLRAKPPLKLVGLAASVFLYINLFIESARGVIVAATVALFVVTILSVRKTAHRVAASLISLMALGVLFAGISLLNTSNDLIRHSVEGLIDPFGERSSAKGHFRLLGEGIWLGIQNPLGFGLGSTTIAGNQFSGQTISSEADIGNKFIATGVLGGILYFLIMVNVLIKAFRKANAGDPVYLIILGVLIACGMQWLTGGHYAVLPLIWIMIGYLDKTSARRLKHENRMDRAHAQ